MRDFQILFDHGEGSEILDPVYARYGKLGFPSTAGMSRPWIYANFVQTLDGISSLLGDECSGSDIAQSSEDRWLVDLLRAHADAVLLGVGTLKAETRLGRPRPRGPVFRIVDPALNTLREKLHKQREKNILITGKADLNFSEFAIFDGDKVDVIVITTDEGRERLSIQSAKHPHVTVIAAGEGTHVDLPLSMQILKRDFNIHLLLCEGGPNLYGEMIRHQLIDEKFLTVAPFDAGHELPNTRRNDSGSGGNSVRPTIFGGEGFDREHMARWRWLSCRKIGDHQFHRFRAVRKVS